MRKIIARQNMAIAAAFRVQSYEMTEDQILHSNKIETLVFNRTVKDRMLWLKNKRDYVVTIQNPAHEYQHYSDRQSWVDQKQKYLDRW